jgi:hypothetical protein
MITSVRRLLTIAVLLLASATAGGLLPALLSPAPPAPITDGSSGAPTPLVSATISLAAAEATPAVAGNTPSTREHVAPTPSPSALPLSTPSPAPDRGSRTPTPQSIPSPSPSHTPPARSTRIARVGGTNGDGVYLRHSPHLADRWVAWRDGTELIILGTEADGDGQHWLQVRDPAGNVGWVPAQFVRP